MTEMFTKYSDIEAYCNHMRIENFTINKVGEQYIVDVDGMVVIRENIDQDNPSTIPIQFGEVNGSFYTGNYLKTLVGCPKIVGTNFVCSSTRIKNLQGAPEEVGGSFVCNACILLTSFDGLPKKIGGRFKALKMGKLLSPMEYVHLLKSDIGEFELDEPYQTIFLFYALSNRVNSDKLSVLTDLKKLAGKGK